MQKITLDQLSILLVEPSSTQQRIINIFLEKFGIIQVQKVTTGQEAIDTMNADLHDLVISAMHLPDMTGTDLVQTMRMESSTDSIPFMLISSETNYRYLEPIRQAGVIALLPKPFESDQLKRALYSTVHYLEPDSLDMKDINPADVRVLLVDDSFTARKHISRVLSNLGFSDITEAKDGKEASDIIKQTHFDLIVTDYNMPEMNGEELIQHVRTDSNQATIPILMVSSESDENRLAAVQQAGVSAVCDKPFESDVVRELLLTMLG